MATDLDAARQRINDLRAQVEEARRSQAAAEAAVAEALQMQELAAEEARLAAVLEAAQAAADPDAIVASNVNNLQAAKDAMAVATGDVSASTDEDNGSTVVKPVGVNLETGELLPPDEAQAAYEQRVAESNEAASNLSVDHFGEVASAAQAAASDANAGDPGVPVADENATAQADDGTTAATTATDTPVNNNASDAGSEGGQ